MSGFSLIKEKTTSKDITQRCAEIGCPSLVPLHQKERLIESNTFSLFTVTKNPSVSKKLVISKTSNISLPLSLINLLSTYAT